MTKTSKFLLIARLLAFVAVFVLSSFSASYAQAQVNEDNAYELIVQVQRGDRVFTNALLGYQVGYSSYYLPVAELGRLLEYYTDLDLEQKKITGWYGEPDNTFTVDLQNGYYTMDGEVTDLAPDDAFIKNYGGDYGDLYLKLERLNELLPVGIEFDFLKLSMRITTAGKLPIEVREEREARRDKALERLGRGNPAYDGYIVHDNPYRMYSAPILDIDSRLGYYGREGEKNGDISIYGRNDFLGFSADYNARFEIDDGSLETPESIRATFTRRAFGDKTMPLGVRELKLGDIGLATPRLLTGANSGRGVSVSSRPVKREQNFDEIVISGTGIPGYEIELYRNQQLIDFGVVSNTGEYRFENIELFAGRNIFRTVLYGPQGQQEERFEEHSIAGSVLSPGELEYDMSVVDTTDNLINLDQDDPFKTALVDKGQNEEGIAYTGRVAKGINNNLTVFATGTNTFTRQGERKYGTVGANFGIGRVLGSTELYKELGGGTAIDTRAATTLNGWNVNLRTGLFRDFESNRAGFEDSAKVYDVDGRVTKRFATALGSAGLQISGSHEKYENENTRSQYRLSTSLARGGQRYGNVLTATYQNRELATVFGRTNANFRINREWSTRSLLTYSVKPTFDFQNFTTDIRYRPNNDLRVGFNYGQNLRDTADYQFGADVGYDFGTFLGSLDTNWRSEGGLDVILRASTTLAPFGDDGGYIFDSRATRSQNALRSKVYLDRNLNNVFDSDDEWLSDTGVLVGGRETDLTNAEGAVSMVQSYNGEYKDVIVDEERLPNPFLRPAQKGHLVLLRPGVSQDVEIPMVETGVIDGSAYFENGSPIPGLKMELLNGRGEVLKTSMTSFDGYFAFEFVKPGTYVVRSDSALNLVIPPRTVSISSDALFAYGVNVNLKDGPKSDIEVEKTQVKQNMAAILTNLKKLQSTLNGTVKKSGEPL